MKNVRKIGNRTQRTPIVFLGKGITEYYYLSHLKNLKYKDLEDVYLKIERKNFNKSNSLNKIQRKIINDLKSAGGGIVVIIRDYEMNFNKNDTENIKIIENKPSIEYWFLLHYEDTNRDFSEQELKKYLTNYISNYSTDENFLEKDVWVRNMLDLLKTAYTRAKKYTNPELSFTEFAKLIDLIEKVPSPKN